MAGVLTASGLVLLLLGFLLPSSDLPWPSFHREWVAALGVVLLAGASFHRSISEGQRLRWPALAVVLLGGAASAWPMWLSGQIVFRADALLTSLYLSAFAVCVAVGASRPRAMREQLLDGTCLVWLAASLISLPIACLQWLGLGSNTGWLSSDLPVYGGRPGAQLGQPNMLALLLLLGLTGVWRFYEARRLAGWIAAVAAVMIVLGVLLTQSRLAWLALPALAIWSFVGARRYGARLHPIWAVAGAVSMACASLALPALNDQLGLSGASLTERLSAGRRPVVWAMFLDAALERPWLGWGWLQNPVAQLAVAAAHPPAAWVFSSAHNIVLDLFIWVGIPVGLALVAGLALGFWHVAARAADAVRWATLWAPLVVGLHSLIELPAMYGIVIWPLGLLLGAMSSATIEAESAGGRWRVQTVFLGAITLVGAVLWLTLGQEYRALQDVRPTVRSPKPFAHAMLAADEPVPQVYLLDHLREFHRFAAARPRARLDDRTVLWASQVASRFPFAAVLEKQARFMAQGGRPAEAEDALSRACLVTTADACKAMRIAWEEFRRTEPSAPGWPD